MNITVCDICGRGIEWPFNGKGKYKWKLRIKKAEPTDEDDFRSFSWNYLDICTECEEMLIKYILNRKADTKDDGK